MSPQTRFTGRQFVFLPVCASTNTVAQQFLIKNEATEGCVILTENQTAGRGQRGNNWEAGTGLNLTLSVIYKPVFLAASDQFFLNMAVSLGVADLLKRFLPAGVLLKWPNDLYFLEKKLGGILIENSISGSTLQNSVIGIGLNVNQVVFDNPNAVSMKQITGQNYALKNLTEVLLECLEKRYLELQQKSRLQMQQEYWNQLLGFGEFRLFEAAGKIIQGKIVGTDEYGRLQLETEKGLQTFDLKEIKFLFS
ncbi:biotin--[acetyl-CoA-carboxylase] ligase [Adhaeribacter sp. BT258]|uniref:biotin--[biotin carboxyl-carrier protein] ligase n=1 Tax=Adhaeribacter terrigena TaxID=2793070 RepID=A0ABS1C5U9_9BACT|nr:biotin--[acetyl-CoA-carboxylase] ligase [Adhaeribacter terrigena]